MKTRVSLALIVLLICSSLVWAGGQQEQSSSADEEVTLRFTLWSGFDGHLNMLNEIAAKYTAKHPNVKVQLDTIPFSDYVSKVTIQLAGSNPPDCGWLVENSGPSFIDAGVLSDLSNAAEQYDYDDFSDSAMTLWERGDQVYGLPFSTSPFIMLYNADLFTQAGVPNPNELAAEGDWTWEKLRDIAKTIKEETGVYAFQTMDGQGYDVRVWHTLIPIMRAYGADAWDSNGNCQLDTPEAIEAVELFHSMIYEDKSVVPPGSQSDFYAGNAAMTVGQISRVGKLKDASFDWGIAVMPKGPAGEAYVIGQAAVVAFKASENREIAADFVAFMTNKMNVKKMAEYFPPARESVLYDEAFLSANAAISKEQMRDVVATSIEKGEVLSFHPNFPKIDLTARAEFDTLWTADADVDAIMNRVAEKVQPLLNQ